MREEEGKGKKSLRFSRSYLSRPSPPFPSPERKQQLLYVYPRMIFAFFCGKRKAGRRASEARAKEGGEFGEKYGFWCAEGHRLGRTFQLFLLGPPPLLPCQDKQIFRPSKIIAWRQEGGIPKGHCLGRSFRSRFYFISWPWITTTRFPLLRKIIKKM